ncbi:hypothetical protein POM88_023706 [Heracleum sosnowskyi]|uniref:Pentatricopeptide repeat-containing protein n=1 Tax=Heracleum sosnowskyi TaxID=360622 RepID=A0AAD8II57_9APIA|nr:hypothetical protein POM88_023706 [Heracleum sosnowskyi]
MIKDADDVIELMIRCAYGKEGMIKDAEDVIELMIRRGHYPDVVTYISFMDGYCLRGKYVVTYDSLMDGYCLRGEVNEALAVLQTMKRRGIVPAIRTYNILINGYCKKLDIAIDLFQQMLLLEGFDTNY